MDVGWSILLNIQDNPFVSIYADCKANSSRKIQEAQIDYTENLLRITHNIRQQENALNPTDLSSQIEKLCTDKEAEGGGISHVFKVLRIHNSQRPLISRSERSYNSFSILDILAPLMTFT